MASIAGPMRSSGVGIVSLFAKFGLAGYGGGMRLWSGFAIALVACGGSVAAPDGGSIEDASADRVGPIADSASPADGSADAPSETQKDAPDEACASLEGAFCGGSASTCGPCPKKGWIYRCVVENGGTTYHLEKCETGVDDCTCGL